MKKKLSEPKIHHLVPASLQSIRATKKTDESPTDPRTIRHTLDESFYKTATGHWKRRDEPGEPRKTEYLTIAPDALRKQKQWDARQRLKRKDAVPTKQGKKLFDEFMREAKAILATTEKSMKNTELSIIKSQSHLMSMGTDLFTP
jgi:hypothetical protein